MVESSWYTSLHCMRYGSLTVHAFKLSWVNISWFVSKPQKPRIFYPPPKKSIHVLNIIYITCLLLCVFLAPSPSSTWKKEWLPSPPWVYKNIFNFHFAVAGGEQQLFVRLFLRKHDWIRESKLSYEDIASDLSPIVQSLVDKRFLLDSKSKV